MTDNELRLAALDRAIQLNNNPFGDQAPNLVSILQNAQSITNFLNGESLPTRYQLDASELTFLSNLLRELCGRQGASDPINSRMLSARKIIDEVRGL